MAPSSNEFQCASVLAVASSFIVQITARDNRAKVDHEINYIWHPEHDATYWTAIQNLGHSDRRNRRYRSEADRDPHVRQVLLDGQRCVDHSSEDPQEP